MIGARLDSVVGFWSFSCIEVLSAIPSVLRTSKVSHEFLLSQSGGIVAAFGSTPVARRQVTTARIIPRGVESTKRVAIALRLSVGGNLPIARRSTPPVALGASKHTAASTRFKASYMVLHFWCVWSLYIRRQVPGEAHGEFYFSGRQV